MQEVEGVNGGGLSSQREQHLQRCGGGKLQRSLRGQGVAVGLHSGEVGGRD